MDINPLGELYSSAIRSGDLDTVRDLLDRHPDPLAIHDVLNQWLHAAAGSNQVGVMALLVERGADVNAPSSTLDPIGPLHTAAAEGAIDAVCWLLERGAELSVLVEGEARCPGLENAVIGGYLQCVRLLVEAGAPMSVSGPMAMTLAEGIGHAAIVDYLRSVEVPEEEAGRRLTDAELVDACTTAAEEGDVATLVRLLGERPQLLATPRELNYNLRAAARAGQVSAMDLLVRHGADVNAPFTEADPAGPIHIAAAHGATEAVRWLLEHGASLTVPRQDEDPCPGLTMAAMGGHLECVRLLVEAGAPLETSGTLALFAAENRGRPEVAAYLRTCGLPADEETMTEDEARELYSPAVRSGDIATVRRLIGLFPDLYGSRDSMDYFLWVAASANQTAMAEFFVSRGADLNAGFTESDPRGAIHFAAADGAVEGVRWLLERGAELTVIEDGKSRCPGLEEAAMGGHLECVRMLIEAGAPLEHSGPLAQELASRGGHSLVADYLRKILARGKGATMDIKTLGETYSPAVRSGDVETVRRMLDEYPEQLANPETLNWYFRSAACSNQIEVMALLFERGADINARYTELDPAGPIHDAAGDGAADAVRWLLERGAALTFEDQGRIRCQGLVHAAMGGHLECVRLFVEAGAPLDLAGESAMAAARFGDHEEVVDYLRSVGVPADDDEDEDQEQDEDETHVETSRVDRDMNIDAIHELYYPAVVAGDIETVRNLLDEHADPLQSQRELDRYLHIAAKKNRIPVMELLVERGANVNAPYSDAEPDGPITRAAMNGAGDAIRWLLEHGASVTTPGNEEDPCPGLTLAAMDGHLECVRLLVEAGAPLETSGDLALFAAKTRGHAAVVEYLRSVGAPEKSTDLSDSELEEEDLPYIMEEEEDEDTNATYGGPLPDLRRHLEQSLLGMLEPDMFQEILPSDPPIRVLVLDRFGVNKALVTEGMSSQAVNGPVPYAELIMYLPPEWPLGEAVRDDRNGWPVHWLRRMAHFPHESGRGFPPVIRFDNEEPLGEGTRFTALLLLAGFGENGSYTRSDGEEVQLYTVLPLYPEENELAESEGLRRLLALFDEHKVGPVLANDRPSVVDAG